MKHLIAIFSIVILSQSIQAQCPVVAAFNANPSQGCATPHTVFFTDQSTFPDTWFWQFGDGATSTAQNPIHSYTTTGTFNITLTITDTIVGCMDQISQSITVSVPTANFNATTLFGCAPISTDFTSTSSSNGSAITSWDWDFGDGNTSTQENPSHVYDQTGTYNVSLTIVDANGCSTSETKNNYIQGIGPDVSFTANTLIACDSLQVDFTDNSTYGAPVTSWNWSFGDGNNASIQNPSHTYNASGNYDVTLTVNDLDGCSRTFTRTEYINILASSNGIDTQIACDSITWIDGNTYTQSNNTATYNIVGGAANSCDSLVTLNLIINTISDLSTTVNSNTITANNSLATYLWLDCNDNFNAITGETNQTFTIQNNGSFAVQLTENGCIDTSICITTSLGITENTFSSELKVFPNPTIDGAFTIQFENKMSFLIVKLYSTDGKLVKSSTYENIDLIHYNMNQPSGIYILEIMNANDQKSTVRINKI